MTPTATALEALQWRQMCERVFGAEMSPLTAELMIEQLKQQASAAKAANAPAGRALPSVRCPEECGRSVLAPEYKLKPGDPAVFVCPRYPRCPRAVVPMRTMQAVPERTR